MTLQNRELRYVGELGNYIRKQKDPTYEERAYVAFSIIEFIEKHKLKEEQVLPIIQAISQECNLDMQDILKIFIHILSDVSYFTKIMRKYRLLFKEDIKRPL